MGFANINFAGREIYLNDLDGADQVAREMQFGLYEAPLPILTLAILVRNPGLFLDVGANNGLYTILAAKALPTSRVVSFEPYPAAVEVFKRNIDANGIADRVDLRQVALSDDEGAATLYLPDQSHGLLETSCSLEADFKLSSEKLEIARTRLDALHIEEPISLIKADIEGHEYAFLNGARETIGRSRPFIFVETLLASQNKFPLLTQFAAQFGYLIFRLRKEAAILTDFVQFDPLAWNQALVPNEKCDLFRHACYTHQIEVVRRY